MLFRPARRRAQQSLRCTRCRTGHARPIARCAAHTLATGPSSLAFVIANGASPWSGGSPGQERRPCALPHLAGQQPPSGGSPGTAPGRRCCCENSSDRFPSLLPLRRSIIILLTISLYQVGSCTPRRRSHILPNSLRVTFLVDDDSAGQRFGSELDFG